MIEPQALREAGLRVTAGRLAVLEVLDHHPHSDAATIHRALGDTTSLQSVHNVLADLATAGIIRRIESVGAAARYERRTHDNHHHLVCTVCGTVADVDCVVGAAPCLHPSDSAGFSVTTADVTFRGICADCNSSVQPN
jgi:Fe2+ or Zn2+ uptake regulation protein